MHELPQEHSERLRPLFEGFGHRLHGLVEAVCTPDFGTAWVDDIDHPRVAVANCDFWFVVGDPHAPAAADALRLFEKGTVVSARRHWDDLARDRLRSRVTTRTRTGFTTPALPAWDRAHLQSLASSVPDGYEVRRVTGPDIPSYVEVAKEFVSNFRSVDDYLEHGLGFGVWQGERCVAGCSSFTLANNKLEVEIDTDPGHRRKGLARAVAATLILHCIEAGIEPCWDAHNPESAALAEQLGFTDPMEYDVMVVG